MKKLLALFGLLIVSTSSFAVVEKNQSYLQQCGESIDATLTVSVDSSGTYYVSSADDSSLTGNYYFSTLYNPRTFRVKNTTPDSFVVVTDFETKTPVVIHCE